MDTLNVVAAVIVNDNRILATQRGYGDYAGYWEFPGGKIEEGETPEQALVREIKEELNVDITVEKFLIEVEHDYPKFHVQLKTYICHIEKGTIELLEHWDAKWLNKENYATLKWLPTALLIIADIEKNYSSWL